MVISIRWNHKLSPFSWNDQTRMGTTTLLRWTTLAFILADLDWFIHQNVSILFRKEDSNCCKLNRLFTWNLFQLDFILALFHLFQSYFSFFFHILSNFSFFLSIFRFALICLGTVDVNIYTSLKRHMLFLVQLKCFFFLQPQTISNEIYLVHYRLYVEMYMKCRMAKMKI